MKKQLFFLGIMVFAVSANASREWRGDGYGGNSARPVGSGGGGYDREAARLGMAWGAEGSREAMESWRETSESIREAGEYGRETAEYGRELRESMREVAEIERERRATIAIQSQMQQLDHRQEMLQRCEAAIHKKEQELAARERALR
jgi:hypothetical protein